MKKGKGPEAYRQLDIESQVLGASPHQLIQLLFSGAKASLKQAQICHSAGDKAGGSRALAKCINIIVALSEALRFDVQSDLPYQLESLYTYMQSRLLSCQQHYSADKCTEVYGLLETLAAGWADIAP